MRIGSRRRVGPLGRLLGLIPLHHYRQDLGRNLLPGLLPGDTITMILGLALAGQRTATFIFIRNPGPCQLWGPRPWTGQVRWSKMGRAGGEGRGILPGASPNLAGTAPTWYF